MKTNEIKELKVWIKALRSNKYPQSRFKMHSPTGYCCLGVACDVLIPKDKLITLDGFIDGISPFFQQAHAPQWLVSINNDFKAKTEGICLMSLNDGTYTSLSEINVIVSDWTGNMVVDKIFTFDEIADLLELVYIHKILN